MSTQPELELTLLNVCHENPEMSHKPLSLDALYKMTSHIYSEQNAHRPASATFAHFVEVCGFLTIHARNKKREDVSFEDALCKALGWYFPLLAKFRVASVEELIYRKYPNVCPYCREAPHVDAKCKTVIGTKRTVDHDALRRKQVENAALKPVGLSQWQVMFDRIYPRNLDDRNRSVVGLFEELGELAEAVRVFERHPKYFAGEAADVFSYLMGIANEYNLQRQRDDLTPFDFEAEYIKRYPGLCVKCGYRICVCPLVPDSTVGRMAKELDVHDTSTLFAADLQSHHNEAVSIAEQVLAQMGGYAGLSAGFPFDRGEANHALVLLCLRLADTIGDPEIAERLRSVALKAGTAATYAGSPNQPEKLNAILAPLEAIVKKHAAELEKVTGAVTPSLPAGVGTLVIHEFVSGDKYTANQVGAQGSSAMVFDPKFETLWKDKGGDIDLAQLASELSALRRHIESSSERSQSAQTVAALDAAELAAKEGKGPRLLAALSKTGSWTLDLAKDLGTEIAAKVIAASLGV